MRTTQDILLEAMTLLGSVYQPTKENRGEGVSKQLQKYLDLKEVVSKNNFYQCD